MARRIVWMAAMKKIAIVLVRQLSFNVLQRRAASPVDMNVMVMMTVEMDRMRILKLDVVQKNVPQISFRMLFLYSIPDKMKVFFPKNFKFNGALHNQISIYCAFSNKNMEVCLPSKLNPLRILTSCFQVVCYFEY